MDKRRGRPGPTMNGVKRGYLRAIYCGFDDDTFATIKKMANENKVSFAEQVRTLVEWGLDTCKLAEE